MLRLSTRLAPLALALALVACQDSTTSPGSHTRLGAGHGFTLLLTDAPGDLDAAVVTISKITLQGTGGSVTLMDTPVTVDLIDLRNEVSTLVRGLDVPAGSYSQLRLVLSGAYISVGGKIYASSPDYPGLNGLHADGVLQMPSMEQSGLKINLPGGKLDVGEDEVIVLIDFDADQSFGHQAGNSGRWVMHPVLKATNVTFGGNVLAQLQLGQGVTLPVVGGQTITLGNFSAVLTPVGGGPADTVALTDTNADGIFEAMFKGLLPGDYTLSFLGPNGLLLAFTPTLPVTVSVLEKQTTTQLVTLTSATVPGSITTTLTLANGVTLPSINGTAVTLSQFKAVLTPPAGPADTTAFTTSNGVTTVAFTNLAAGTYSLNVLNPTGTTVTFTQTLPLSINLTAGATVNDTVTIKTITAP